MLWNTSRGPPRRRGLPWRWRSPPWLDEFVGVERRARGIRHGTRWNFFQDCRRHPPKIPHARPLPAFSGRAGKFDGADGNIRRADQSFYFCRMDLLCLRRRRALSNAQNRTGFAAPLPLLGLSLGSGPVRGRRARAYRKYLAGSPRPLLDWLALDSRRASVLQEMAKEECKS